MCFIKSRCIELGVKCSNFQSSSAIKSTPPRHGLFPKLEYLITVNEEWEWTSLCSDISDERQFGLAGKQNKIKRNKLQCFSGGNEIWFGSCSCENKCLRCSVLHEAAEISVLGNLSHSRNYQMCKCYVSVVGWLQTQDMRLAWSSAKLPPTTASRSTFRAVNVCH